MSTVTRDDRSDAAAGTSSAPAVVHEAAPRLRAALVVNPYSSGMTSKRERAIVATLRERIDVDVHRTERSGHAPGIAAALLESDNLDVLIACGGDGTANEVLNGMSLADDTADARPAFAILPAGGTNVLARSIGLPNHPMRATSKLLDAIVERRHRTINLGTVDERVFMFAAGVGIDAEVVKRTEQRRNGRRASDVAIVSTIVGIYLQSRLAIRDCMTITAEGDAEPVRSAMLLVGNTTPFTYMGRMPMHFLPDCTLEGGLDFIATPRANAAFALRNAARAIGKRPAKDGGVGAPPAGAVLGHDLASITVECDEPQAVQADGEYLGDRTHVRFGLLRRAVRLVG